MITKSNQLERVLLILIEISVYLSLFTPLIFFRNYFFPFVTPKSIFFRMVVCFVFIIYLLLARLYPKYRPSINSLTLAIIVFLVVLFLTALLGVNFQKSFWSVYERMTGLLTILHLFIFYLILTSVFKERKHWERILTVSIFICLIVNSLAFIGFNTNMSRGGSTLGNSTFFSAYLLFNLFFAIICLFLKTGWYRIFYILSILFFLVGLFFNPNGFTKGAVSGFILGLVFFVIVFFLFYSFSSLAPITLDQRRKLKIIGLALLIFLVFAGSISLIQFGALKEKAIKLWQSGSVQARLVVWQIAWQGWRERLWLGWGWENFNIPFAKYFQPKLPLTGDIWYDRAHNIILDTGVTTGIIGLLSYLSIFIIAILGLVKLLKNQPSAFLISLTLVTLLLVYFWQNLWAFDMISSYVMFFLTLAFISYFTTNASLSLNRAKVRARAILFSWPSLGLLILLTFLFFYFGNLQALRAARLIIFGHSVSSVEQSVSFYEKALQISPLAKFEVPERMFNKMEQLMALPSVNKESLITGFELTAQEFRNTLQSSQQDFRLYLFLGRHYLNFYQLTKDETKLSLAEENLLKAKELSPRNQQVYWWLAQVRLHQDRIEEALSFANQAIALEPKYLNSHLMAINIALFSYNTDLIKQQVQLALKINPLWEKEIEEFLTK
ncbi:MAG: O-antigen ligase family protein [Minisyncoccales bacterium]